MIRPLVAKEVRDQRPFLWLALFFIALDVLSDLWTVPLGFAPYADTFEPRFKADGDLSMMTFILAFALGCGLLVREQDDRTLEFLDALPTSRWTLFWVKLLVALATVLVYPLGTTLWVICHQLWSRTSLDPGLHLDVMAVASVLRVAQAFTVLALALALAPLRRLCWTALAVLMLSQSILEERMPWLSVLNPLRLTAPRFEGTGWRWPVEALRLQLSVACVLLGLALAQFLGWGERLAASVQRRLQGSWMGTLATLATVGLFLAVFIRSAANDGPAEGPQGNSEGPQVEFPTTATAQAATGRYEFNYPASLRKRAEPLLDGADGAFEKVRAFLGVEAGDTIRADLSGSARHTAGTAYWNTLRLNLAGLSQPEEALAVLGHETTHVLSQRIAGAETAPRLSTMKLLGEGLASYVEYRFFYPPGAEEEYQLIAAAARARREVKTEELLDLEKLAAERDENQVYPLGRAFIEVLVRRHGDGAPRACSRRSGGRTHRRDWRARWRGRTRSRRRESTCPRCSMTSSRTWTSRWSTAGSSSTHSRGREEPWSARRARWASGPWWTGRCPRAGRWSAASVRTRHPATTRSMGPTPERVPTGERRRTSRRGGSGTSSGSGPHRVWCSMSPGRWSGWSESLLESVELRQSGESAEHEPAHAQVNEGLQRTPGPPARAASFRPFATTRSFSAWSSTSGPALALRRSIQSLPQSREPLQVIRPMRQQQRQNRIHIVSRQLAFVEGLLNHRTYLEKIPQHIRDVKGHLITYLVVRNGFEHGTFQNMSQNPSLLSIDHEPLQRARASSPRLIASSTG